MTLRLMVLSIPDGLNDLNFHDKNNCWFLLEPFSRMSEWQPSTKNTNFRYATFGSLWHWVAVKKITRFERQFMLSDSVECQNSNVLSCWHWSKYHHLCFVSTSNCLASKTTLFIRCSNWMSFLKRGCVSITFFVVSLLVICILRQSVLVTHPP